MIYLYTKKENSEDWILQNDWYFNVYTGNYPLNQEEKKIIEKIDGAKVSEDMHIQTKYGIGTIRNLSSGCKTYLNVVKNPGKIVSVEECGPNVLDLLFCLDDIRIYMNRPERFHIGENVQICINDSDIVKGRSGYENWWSKEYERRGQDDL